MLGLAACTTSNPPPTAAMFDEAHSFIAENERTVRPLEIALNRAWWDANITGTDAAFQAKEEAQNRLDEALSDPAQFAALKHIHDVLQGSVSNAEALTARQIHLIYLQRLEKQVPAELLKKLSAKGNAIEKAFNVYRAKANGKELTDSQVREVLKTSKDSRYRSAVWEASKGVGSVVEADLKELVKLRNESARKLGFKDYHVMELFLNEQSQEQVLKLFNELDTLTREPFTRVKAELDASLAKDYGIAPGDLRPWHYQDPFFQEAPAFDTSGFDAVYAKADLLKLSRDFYAGIGLPVDAVLARSDLYEKPGKSPHAFSTDIDRAGDVRVLANVVPNEYWMGTLLHELGHSVYSSINIPPSMPYALRMESHILTTEGIAMMLEKFSKNAGWMERMGLTVPEREALQAAGARARRSELLIFAAWAQVMFRFEMAMYANPDQDLNKLWWDLVERYQRVHRADGRNAPDYAAKIHIVSSPAYYHNYLMGELFAAQVHHTIAREVLKTEPAQALYNGRPDVGQFLKDKIFTPGRSLSWNDLTRYATGEGLNPKAFAEDLKVR